VCFVKKDYTPAAMNCGLHSGHLAHGEPIVKPAGAAAGCCIASISSIVALGT